MGIVLSNRRVHARQRPLGIGFGWDEVAGKVVAHPTEVDRFEVPAGDQGRSQGIDGFRPRRQGASRMEISSRTGILLVTDDPGHLFDQVRLEVQVEPVAGHGDVDCLAGQDWRQPQAEQRVQHLRGGDLNAQHPLDHRQTEGQHFGIMPACARFDDAGEQLPAGQFEHELRRPQAGAGGSVGSMPRSKR